MAKLIWTGNENYLSVEIKNELAQWQSATNQLARALDNLEKVIDNSNHRTDIMGYTNTSEELIILLNTFKYHMGDT